MLRRPLVLTAFFTALWALAPVRAQAPEDSARAAQADSVAQPDSVERADSTVPPRAGALSVPATASGALTEYAEPYYLLSTLNEGVSFDDPANLQTPQAALEYFWRAGREDRFAEAAQALNLNLVPEADRAALAPRLAERLHYLFDKQIGYDWEGLPDRPDGLREGPASSNDPLAGTPRRSVRVGSLPFDGREAAIRLQRVKVDGAAPVWVFSPQTVENIGALYERYGPGPVDRMLPDWAKVQVLGQTALWAWLALLGLVVLAFLGALIVRRIAIRRLSDADSHWLRGVAELIATPIAAVAALLFLYLAAAIVLTLPTTVTTILLILVIIAVAWLAMRTVRLLTEHIATDEMEDISELSGNEKTAQQQRLTYLSVGRRVLFFILFLLACGVIIGQFEAFESIGVTLMASAGVATVLLGIAAQPVLGNIVAGLQIALSKPVRIGDSVLYEGNWGYVEDITYTYLLIQTWDQRRLVVPLRYFVTHPFENWTKRDAHLTKPIVLRADYTIDVERVREKFDDLLRADADWDEENEPSVQVIGVDDETVEIRALCSAKDPSTAWDLHCRLREQLVAFVRDLDGGAYLPRQRVLNVKGEGASLAVDGEE
jgi:small-conductance mechanosensitive channel